MGILEIIKCRVNDDNYLKKTKIFDFLSNSSQNILNASPWMGFIQSVKVIGSMQKVFGNYNINITSKYNMNNSRPVAHYIEKVTDNWDAICFLNRVLNVAKWYFCICFCYII